jgi:mevalonate pyrophosphate decarboxylase
VTHDFILGDELYLTGYIYIALSKREGKRKFKCYTPVRKSLNSQRQIILNAIDTCEIIEEQRAKQYGFNPTYDTEIDNELAEIMNRIPKRFYI